MGQVIPNERTRLHMRELEPVEADNLERLYALMRAMDRSK